MSYVLHVYRMTYKTYDMQEYIFVHPEEWYSISPILLLPLHSETSLNELVNGC